MIFIEGNIGAGKSEFLKAMLKHNPNCAIIPEPVPGKYLPYLYERPELWAYPFQLIMAVERKTAQNNALRLEEDSPGKLVFLERSLHADSIFAEVAIEDQEEKEKYRVFRKEILGDIIAKPDMIIYLRSTSEGCQKRIKERMGVDESRECEDVIRVDYLQKIHDKHEEWLVRQDDWLLPTEQRLGYPILVLNTEEIDWRLKSVSERIFDRIVKMLKVCRLRAEKLEEFRKPKIWRTIRTSIDYGD